MRGCATAQTETACIYLVAVKPNGYVASVQGFERDTVIAITTALWPPVTVVPAETVMSVTFAKVVVLVKVTLLPATLPALKDCKKPL